MNFFGKYYLGVLIVSFVVGLILLMIFGNVGFLNSAIAFALLWATASIVERLVYDYSFLNKTFFVAFDVLELVIFVYISIITIIGAVYSFYHSPPPSWAVITLVILCVWFFILVLVRNYLLKCMVWYEWQSNFDLLKSTVERVKSGEVVDVESLSMSAKLIHLRHNFSLKDTAKLLGKSPSTIRYYCMRKDLKRVV